MADCTLPRNERLRSLGAVRRLFTEGEKGFIYPFRYLWYAEVDSVPTVEVLFNVPKKFHKRANKRNLLRRRTKEAYRLNKATLHAAAEERNIDLALIYSAKEELPYERIEKAVRRILQNVVEHL